MHRPHLDDVLSSAHRVLEDNRLYGLTVPHRQLFPAAYLWDTSVTAKGIAVFDPDRAAGEVLRYLQSQWRSGLLPNEVYFDRIGPRDRLFGDHPDRPDGLTTSGITQPLMIVRTVLEVGRRLDRDGRDRFHARALPRLVRMSRWLLARRIGPGGLAVAIHPFETGMDNRIDLAGAMAREWLVADSRLGRLARGAGETTVAAVRRLVGDGRRVPVSQRSSDADLLAAFLQLRHIRRLGYDLEAIRASGRGVLVEDVGFNAVLLDAFACLAELASEAAGPSEQTAWVDEVLRPATGRLAERLEELWFPGSDTVRGGYYSRDARTGRLLLRPTVAGLFPLLHSPDGACDRTARAQRTAVLLDALTDPGQYWTAVAPPSAPLDSAGFSAERYWRGAAWSFSLDIIDTALGVQGRPEIARELRRRYLERSHGPVHAEYENPDTGRPLGIGSFSPAAALTLRLAGAEGLL
jgi:hypothetical protein